jgi:hypothetical protein
MSESTRRPAQPGELCTCGRPAVVVYTGGSFPDVGDCGIEGAAFRPVLPCPWCRIDAAHVTGWGDPAKCPSYRLRAPEQPGVAQAGER